MTRVVAIADLHGNLPAELPDGDVLVIAGDVCPVYDHGTSFQARWLARDFYPWLERQPHGEIVWIAGNHDFVCQLVDWRPDGPGHYLRDTGADVAGLSFYGTPWVPKLPSWAFHADPEELRARTERIPQVDVLVSHGPPLGIGDRLARGGHAGSASLLERLDEAPPQLCVFGHIHEDPGTWRRGQTTLANVAHVDVHYRVRPSSAQTFEIAPRSARP